MGGAEIGITQINNSDANDGGNLRIRRARGTQSTPTVLSSGDNIGGIHWYGHDGTDYGSEAASIWCQVDGTPGSNDMPGRLLFYTTPDGSSSRAERMRIDSEGKVGIGTISPETALSVIHDYNTTDFLSQLTNGQGGGHIIKYGAGSLTVGKLYYLDTTSDGTWTLTDADDPASGGSQLLGVSVAPVNHSNIALQPL